MDMSSILKAKEYWDRFKHNHPKFPMFINAVSKRGIHEGSVIAISVTDPNGEVMETNIKVSSDDITLFESLKNMRMQ